MPCSPRAGARTPARSPGSFPTAPCWSHGWRETPRSRGPAGALLFVVLGYLALPIDLVPDFLPGVGQLDDAAMLALALRVLASGADRETLRAAWPGPESSLSVILIVAGAH